MKFSAVDTFRALVEPVFRRPDFVQTAAICVRDGAIGREVLLVSSRGSKRWIVPKGWPMKHRTLAQAALQEAWEEAGVIGTVNETCLGTYSYRKMVKGGVPVTCNCDAFLVDVTQLADEWPEKAMRGRVWMSPSDASEAVAELGLKKILLEL